MKSISKKISIIVVTYNSSKTINTLLKSIDTLSNQNLIKELIIIENNSPDRDETTKIFKKYKFNYIKSKQYVLSKANYGFAKSCNIGASLASGDFLLFLNPDTELISSSLNTLLSHAIKNNTDLIGGLSERYDGEIHKTVVRYPTLLVGLLEFSNIGKFIHNYFGNNYFYYVDKNLYQSRYDTIVEGLGGAYLLVKKSSFHKLNGFDERFFMYLEDVDLCYRANLKGMKIQFCPHSKIKHIGGASSKNKYHIRHQAWYDSRKAYYKKHFGVLANILIQFVFNVDELILKIRSKYL